MNVFIVKLYKDTNKVPKDQIKLYKDNGVTLTQNPGWDAE